MSSMILYAISLCRKEMRNYEIGLNITIIINVISAIYLQ